MEKMTRVQKYKELRENMKEEVSIERNTIIEETDDEDDFLDFLPKEETEENLEDTLDKPLIYESLNEDSKEVKDALNKAKINVGKDQYNTRLDILNKIRSENKANENNDSDTSDLSAGHVVNGNAKKTSLLEKLASMSPEEDVKELEKFEKETVKKEPEKKPIKKAVENIETVELDIDEDEDEEKGDKLLTVLNVIIIILIIAFLALIGLFVKQLFF